MDVGKFQLGWDKTYTALSDAYRRVMVEMANNPEITDDDLDDIMTGASAAIIDMLLVSVLLEENERERGRKVMSEALSDFLESVVPQDIPQTADLN
jgi:hypothetical protein